MKYIVIKFETKSGAHSYDDIKPDKFLSKLVLEKSNGYPWKNWSSNIKDAIIFYGEEEAKAACTLLRSNSPFIFKVITLDD